MRLQDHLNEIKAGGKLAGFTYYHGTPVEKYAKKISIEGLKGAEVQGKGQLAPVAGRVYMTHDISYALIYALGGVLMGHDVPERWIQDSRYGYVFVINPKDLQDIQPDEDEVGELAVNGNITWLTNLGMRLATERQWRQAKQGEYSYYAAIGKKLLKKMNPKQMEEVMLHAKNVASSGVIMPSEVWQIDKLRSKELDEDGKNFFKIAKKIKMGKIK